MDFLLNLAPFVMVLLLLDTGLLVLMFRSRVHATRERQARIMGFDENKATEDRPLMITSLAVLALVIVGFPLHGVLNVSAAVVAIAGAVALMILAGARETAEFFHEVEWGTIFLFIGLFLLGGRGKRRRRPP